MRPCELIDPTRANVLRKVRMRMLRDSAVADDIPALLTRGGKMRIFKMI